jgi:hypothetical protein
MMKKLIFTLLTLSFFITAKADVWDDLTQNQAKAVQSFLKKSMFVLDYCDCCDDSEVFLLKITNTEIIPCSWNAEKFSVKASAWRIAKLETIKGEPTAYRAAGLSELVEFTITMNYTFVFSKSGKWAVPLFKEVAYDRDHICKGATKFPNPSENENITDSDYKKWYAKSIGS